LPNSRFPWAVDIYQELSMQRIFHLSTAHQLLAGVCCALALWGGRLAAGEAATPSAAADSEAGFTSLVGADAKKQWVGYRENHWPAGWELNDGVLHRAAPADNLMTVSPHRDFELRFDWKVAPGANSGVMCLVNPKGVEPYHTGPEYQVLDNAIHKDGKNPLTSAGSIYALYPPTEAAAKPAGQWNSGAIRLEGGRLQHFLNGKLVAEAQVGGDDWNQRVAGSKFSAWPGFGKEREGCIVLQDHGDEVWFRNVRIRDLAKPH
jgi:hypothetical protein